MGRGKESLPRDRDELFGVFCLKVRKPLFKELAVPSYLLFVLSRESHGDKVRKRGKLLLPVRDECAELVEIIVFRGRKDTARGVFTAREALSDSAEVGIEPVEAKQEHSGIPHTGLYLVDEHRRVAFVAETVDLSEIFLSQPYPAVIHHNYLVKESGDLAAAAVICIELFSEIFRIVDLHGDDLI